MFSHKGMVTGFGIFRSLFLLLAIASCTNTTEERIDKVSQLLPNGRHLKVEKHNRDTKSVGMLTHYDYGTTHFFTYQLSIDHGDIDWDGGSGEPKHLLFCDDTTYIHYLKEKRVPIVEADSTDHITEETHAYQIQDVYEKHIDERYLFNLLGKDYWVEISSRHYAEVRKTCDEYPVPNDNEMSLLPATTESAY